MSEMYLETKETTSAGTTPASEQTRYEPRFRVDIVDEAGVVVADVEKTLYIRRKNNDGLQALEPRGRRG